MSGSSMNLQEFLMQNPVDNVMDEVTIKLKRNGKYTEGTFKIKAITGEEFNSYQKQCNRIKRHGKSEYDSKLFNELVVVNHTVDPNFKDAESVKKMGCATAEQFMYKVLLSGEIAELSQQILSLSGFDQDMDELKEEAKNS